MYQAYPGGAQPPEGITQSPSSIPHSVARAVQLMYAGAVASLIGIVIELATFGSLRGSIHARKPSLTPAELTTAVHVAIGVSIVGGLIGVALWVWMAQSCKAGKGWARILSTVFFALNSIGALASVSGASTLSVASGASRIYGFLVWMIGLGAIIFLWQRASSNYFRSAPRY